MQVLLAAAVLFFLTATTTVFGQQTAAPPVTQVLDGPDAPDAPITLARDEGTGKSTIRATKLTEPLRLDGQLDEPIYTTYPGFDGMVQAAPRYREPSTEKTEIWVSFDGDNDTLTVEGNINYDLLVVPF